MNYKHVSWGLFIYLCDWIDNWNNYKWKIKDGVGKKTAGLDFSAVYIYNRPTPTGKTGN